jgi:NAD(P)-dependent dehydrogenase (short-subunit alcohol dehydrogenase family)
MVFGPAEAFTPEQLAELYDVNVLSTQRVNRAALPQLRKQREGLLVWVSSSSSAGGTPPYLAPYFAAKAGMDALAVIYGWCGGKPSSCRVRSPGHESFCARGLARDPRAGGRVRPRSDAGLADRIMKGFASIAAGRRRRRGGRSHVRVVDTPFGGGIPSTSIRRRTAPR